MKFKMIVTFCLTLCFINYSGAGSVKKQLEIPLVSTTNLKGNEDVKTDKDMITTTEDTKKNCMCSKIYDPVCGTDEKSYYNICQLECENKSGRVIVKHQGNCIPF